MKIKGVLMLLLGILAMAYLVHSCSKGMMSTADEVNETYTIDKALYDSNLGKEYVLNNDTLKIIDYSMWNKTYTLSNGVKINSKLINKEK